MPQCDDFCPPDFSGHWREWHRGHGCHLDDGKKDPLMPETPVDTYTPLLWVTLNDDERYEEYVRVRERAAQLEAENREILDGMGMWLDYVYGRNYSAGFGESKVAEVIQRLQMLLDSKATGTPPPEKEDA